VKRIKLKPESDILDYLVDSGALKSFTYERQQPDKSSLDEERECLTLTFPCGTKLAVASVWMVNATALEIV
jgi:hypothetical protein